MAGLADLVERSQPAYFGGGVPAAVTAGSTWSRTIVDVLDDDGTPILLLSEEIICKVVRDGVTVVDLETVGGEGEFTIALPAAQSATIAPDRYQWVLVLDDGTSRVTVWGQWNSDFEVRAGVGV